ncbi:hypothetical protein LCGC14_2305370 [marine sediment metagenome]|uniref:Uncharacterized protein n=1 Tax=marine sediment metagenome TaxID=412755 RepID=A0A0F9D9Q9_9ZZZZ
MAYPFPSDLTVLFPSFPQLSFQLPQGPPGAYPMEDQVPQLKLYGILLLVLVCHRLEY